MADKPKPVKVPKTIRKPQKLNKGGGIGKVAKRPPFPLKKK